MSIRFAILTVSDRSFHGVRPDASGPALEKRVTEAGWVVSKRDIRPDDLLILRDTLVQWADSGEFDVILTTGGTGFAPRDVTPEATESVLERPAPGLAEAMRSASLGVTPHAMLSRGAAGIRKRVLIINLPGSPKAALENLEVIIPVLPHAIQLLQEEAQAELGHQFHEKS
jgi:molybdenum cofactor synthesis domain-containing protein